MGHFAGRSSWLEGRWFHSQSGRTVDMRGERVYGRKLTLGKPAG
jgi:hypothetical protein